LKGCISKKDVQCLPTHSETAFIKEQNTDVILSGCMGGRAIQFFEQNGIKAATGAVGTVRQSLENYLCGNLTGAAPCDESVAHGHGKRM
jgi:predicted Fe-Mo cluster-binding NifX family protein